jgi:phosphatidylethanolamine/phosphatidyl-N-methylethanolamine N-methyltransferase
MADAARSYWDRNASRYDRSMVLLGGPMPRMLQLVVEELRGAGDVLEVAAGTGLVTAAVAPVVGRLLATDYSAPMVERLAERVRREGLANVTCRVADLYALDLPAASFDAVVGANVLHLLPDLEGALAAMRRLLRPGGRLVVPTYAHAQTLSAQLVSRILGTIARFPGRRRLSAASLRAAVERAGFEVTAAEVVPGLVPIACVVGRLR